MENLQNTSNPDGKTPSDVCAGSSFDSYFGLASRKLGLGDEYSMME
jgi:hypothetical protein